VIGWLDCSAGVSGDMLLGAVVDAGAPLEVLQRAVDALGVEPVRLRAEPAVRGGIGALRVHVEVADRPAPRTWRDLRALLEAAPLDPAVAARALDVFGRLATAEAEVHRVAPDDVHFHEVGALDALADVVGACAGLVALGSPALTVSPVAVGSGTTRGAHGPLPIPVPAVLALLRGAPVLAGAVAHEAATPTGAALVATWAVGFGPLPPMTTRRTGTGAGGRDPVEAANVLRLVLGDPADGAGAEDGLPRQAGLLLEANVDDLDPRLWPAVLARLLDEGASDAWLTPILMKKGRPAHTLSVLCHPDAADRLRRTVFTETSTIGVREQTVAKTALERTEDVVDVRGQAVRVKRARLDGEVVNSSPEWEDVAAAARTLGVPAKQVLAEAVGRAAQTGAAQTGAAQTGAAQTGAAQTGAAPTGAGQTRIRKLSEPTPPSSGADTTS
jgi:pyridinium-3,5-bisthiocarboxylic acid mononucleotide nickel chelatase